MAAGAGSATLKISERNFRPMADLQGSFFLCRCDKIAAAEVTRSRVPVRDKYPFYCVACVKKYLQSIFAAHKKDGPLPEWKFDDDKNCYIQLGEQPSTEIINRPAGIEATDEIVAELVAANLSFKVVKIEGENAEVREYVPKEEPPAPSIV